MKNGQTSQDFKNDFLNGDWIDELLELATILNQVSADHSDDINCSTASCSLSAKSHE